MSSPGLMEPNPFCKALVSCAQPRCRIGPHPISITGSIRLPLAGVQDVVANARSGHSRTINISEKPDLRRVSAEAANLITYDKHLRFISFPLYVQVQEWCILDGELKFLCPFDIQESFEPVFLTHLAQKSSSSIGSSDAWALGMHGTIVIETCSNLIQRQRRIIKGVAIYRS